MCACLSVCVRGCVCASVNTFVYNITAYKHTSVHNPLMHTEPPLSRHKIGKCVVLQVVVAVYLDSEFKGPFD